MVSNVYDWLACWLLLEETAAPDACKGCCHGDLKSFGPCSKGYGRNKN